MGGLINRETISKYIENNELAYQFLDGIVEFAHGYNSVDSISLSSIVRNSSEVFIASFSKMKDEFPDLVDWAREESDALIFVNYDVLICIPKKDIANIQ